MSIWPYHFGTGDHRAFVVDFQINIILGELSVPFCALNKRCLTCTFPIIVQRYLERVEAQDQLHNVPFKTNQLKEHWHSLTPLRREVRLNIIDGLATDLIINAEKKRRKFRTGEVAYFPKTAKSGETWSFWKLLLKHKLRERKSFAEVLTFSVELDIVDFYTISVENIKNHVSTSRIEHLTHKFSAVSRRNKHLRNTHQQHKLTTEILKTR